MRLKMVYSFGSLALFCTMGLLLTGCASSHATEKPSTKADSDWFRSATNRSTQTIFSPIDLPTANEQRLASGVPGPAYWQQRADYSIDVTLDADDETITGRETITYTNNSPHDLDYLWLNLEQNLFKTDSQGARSVPQGTRFANRSAFEGGYNDLIVTGSQGELPISVYDTLGRIDLPEPLLSGQKMQFDVSWTFQIPKYGADRLAIEEVEQGKVFEIAQWFPNLCVYDDTHGWNTLDYLGQGEFYTNFGDYDVRITVPGNHIVVATGTLQNPEAVLTETQLQRLTEAHSSDETVVIRSADEVGDPATRPEADELLTWQFKAHDVRTFAFSSSDAFIWDAAFLPDSGPDHTGTLVQSAYPKEALPLWEQSTQMLKTAIKGYNQRWFTYPYPSAINVNGKVGGMEYPMIIYCRARKDEHRLYGVTTHEIGHNWFPMVVSNDERRHAWMDEGFNTFINHYSRADWFPDEENSGGRAGARRIASRMVRPNQQPIMTYADRVHPRSLGFLAYAKTAAGLIMLREQILGEERFDAAFRAYIKQWAFKNPQPADFFRSMEDGAGVDLAWFWRGWFMETSTLDQAVTSVTQNEEKGTALVTIFNLGELVMPVVLEVRYADGTRQRKTLPVQIWAYSTKWSTSISTDGKAIASITIDPDKAFPDVDLSNNVWGE